MTITVIPIAAPAMRIRSSYAFYVELENSDDLIFGQHVYMEEDTGDEEQKDGLWLEDYYIMQEDDGKAYVWMADKNNQLTKQEVTLGDYDEDEMKYEITDGLTEDDYITVPQDGIQEGAPVIYNDASRTPRRWTVSWERRSDGSDEMDGSWSDGSDEMERFMERRKRRTWMQIILMEMPVTAWSMMQIRAAMSRTESNKYTGRLSCDPEIGAYL